MMEIDHQPDTSQSHGESSGDSDEEWDEAESKASDTKKKADLLINQKLWR
jgi:hypothetical protein